MTVDLDDSDAQTRPAGDRVLIADDHALVRTGIKMLVNGVLGTARPAGGLTPRQEQIRALLRRGMSNKLIAAELGISEGTVKNHITEIFKVLKTSNRTQAAQTEFTD